MAYVVIGCQSAVALVFLVSALSKLRNRAAFRAFTASIRDLRALRAGWVRPAATLTVALEAIVVVLLAVPATVGIGFVLAAALLSVFGGVILLALRRRVRVPCRCFGASNRPLGRVQLVRNLQLLTIALVGGIGAVTLAAQALQPGGIAVAATAGLATGVLVIAFDDVVDLFSTPAARSSPR